MRVRVSRTTGFLLVLVLLTSASPLTLAQSTGGVFQLTGGFWANGVIMLSGDGLSMDGFEGF